MKQKYFDVLPPAQPKASTKFKEWAGFFVSAVLVFMVLMAGAAYTRGQEWFYETAQTAFAGYERLEKGISSATERDFLAASRWFSGAQESFQELAESALLVGAQSGGLLKTGHYSRAAENLVQVGVSVAKLGTELSALAGESQALWNEFIASVGTGSVDPALSQKIQEKINFYETFYQEVIEIQNRLAEVPVGSLPSDLGASVQTAQQKVGQALAYIRQGRPVMKAITQLMGGDMPHTLLILFQNNHERRATGGFIGSYALVELNDFAVTRFEIKDVYEGDGQLSEVIAPPPGIDKVADRLYLRDANYSPDFPTSARLIADLLEKSRGPTVDTIIAIDQNVLESVLRLVGPVNLPQYNLDISAENFNRFLSLVIESKLSGAKNPKQVLRNLFPAIQKKLAGVDPLQLSDEVKKLIREKNIQVYSETPAIQSLTDEWGLSGRFPVAQQGVDFWAIVTTSIGGNKSDGYINTEVDHQTNTLTIEKTHTWNDAEWQKIKALQQVLGKGLLADDSLRYIMGEGPNVDYMRVYVPKGATLVSATGVEITQITTSEDLGYTVFGFIFGPVVAGEQKTVTLEYQLP